MKILILSLFLLGCSAAQTKTDNEAEIIYSPYQKCIEISLLTGMATYAQKNADYSIDCVIPLVDKNEKAL